jgi:Fe-S-cluster containining protein
MSKSNRKLRRAQEQLRKLYKKIPDTKGCMEHIDLPASKGGCGGWCCRFQTPSLLYCEFLNAWEYILDNFDDDEVARLIDRTLRAYLSGAPTKGCVLWDESTRLCMQHKTRPLACRMYGIIPDKEFSPRYEKLKIEFQDRPDAVIRNQCNLVSTADGRESVTKSESDTWWKELTEIERKMGVSKSDIHDGPGGSYRTYHDHIMLQICSNIIMRQLEMLRQHGDNNDKEMAIGGLVKALQKSLELHRVEQKDEQTEEGESQGT